MRMRHVLFGVLAVFSGVSHAQTQAKIEDLAWLTGCWMLERADGFSQEHWLAPAGGAMVGVARNIRGGQMKEFEFLSIREVEGRLSYVAIPSRQKETVFPLAKFSATDLVFENPTHDFPQRVIYRKVPDGIVARIEGTIKGKERGEDYPFKRCT